MCSLGDISEVLISLLCATECLSFYIPKMWNSILVCNYWASRFWWVFLFAPAVFARQSADSWALRRVRTRGGSESRAGGWQAKEGWPHQSPHSKKQVNRPSRSFPSEIILDLCSTNRSLGLSSQYFEYMYRLLQYLVWLPCNLSKCILF